MTQTLRWPGFILSGIFLFLLWISSLTPSGEHFSAQAARLPAQPRLHAAAKPARITKAGEVLLGCPAAPLLNIYTSPSDQVDVVDWLLQGTCVRLDARSQDSRWLRIASDERAVSMPGWVAADGMLTDRDIQLLSTPPGQVALKAMTLQACLNSVSSLNIRSGPGRVYSAVGYLMQGECAEVVGISRDRAWLQTPSGWIAGYYVDVNGELDQIPVSRQTPDSL